MRIENKPTRKKGASSAKETPVNMYDNNNTKAPHGQRGQGRTRSWTFIVYPDSAPENWREIIDSEHIEWVESPLHDKDTNADGTPKKPHWHVLVMYESVKDYHQVKELTDKLHTPAPQKCNGAKGLVRYMAHLDNPEKYQYNKSDIVGHGGADVGELLRPSASESLAIQGEMIDFIIKYDVVEYIDLVTYARYNRPDWFEELTCRSFNVVQIIKSRRHCGRKPVDPTTGEIYALE